MKEKYKCIYNPQLAGFLMFNGIHLKRVDRNMGRPWTNVYLFEDNDKIKGLIDEYKKLKSTEENKNGIINRNYRDKIKSKQC